MKLKKMMVVVLMALMSVRAWAAKADAAMSDNDGLCDLIREMQGVFGILRTLAFVGAGFIIASWAWGWISAGKVELKDVKDKGIGMLVGFVVLFALGAILSAFMSMADEGGSLKCATSMFN